MPRFPSAEVKALITSDGNSLIQTLSFPDGSVKTGYLNWPLCEVGEELVDDLIRRGPGTVYSGTQQGWHDMFNQLLGARNQFIDFSKDI